MLGSTLSASDRTLAKRNAEALAGLLDANVVSNTKVRVGESRCPYQVRYNFDDFWFGVLVSSSGYVVQSNHKDRFADVLSFSFSLKKPAAFMYSSTELPDASKQLGVPVFAGEGAKRVSSVLLSSKIKRIVGALDYAPLEICFASPVQLYAVSELITPAHCAEQVRLLKRLQSSLRTFDTRSTA